MEQLDVQSKTGYGAVELKRYSHKYWAIALTIALVLHFSGIGAYWGSIYFSKDDGLVNSNQGVRVAHFLLPIVYAPRVGPVVAGGLKPRVGIPIPVPINRADTTATIPRNSDYDREGQPEGPDSLGVGAGEFREPENEPPPADFVAFEKAPEAVKQVQPKYPDLAARAGLEGTVWVKIWVDREGKPKKTVVQKSDAEIFNQPAAEAAMQWIFTPAMMKQGPVSVWVSIPFRFKLQGK